MSKIKLLNSDSQEYLLIKDFYRSIVYDFLMKLYLVIILFLVSLSPMAKKVVLVGGYEFPPFVTLRGSVPRGMTIDLIELLNKEQSKYLFKFVPTTPDRRYIDFSTKKYDLIFFENIIWGWQEEPIEPTKVILNGGEVFITKAVDGRDKEFFSTLKDKKILGVTGYHYNFANHVTNKDYLQKYFNMTLNESHSENIRSVIKSESPTIAIVTKSYLDLFINNNPDLKDKILISNKFDQIYRHTILARKNNNPSAKELSELIDSLKQTKKIQSIWKKYGVEK